MTKLWVDDIREAPDDSWIVAKNYDEAISVLEKGFVDVISLDHDLGENSRTGYAVVCFIENQLRCGNIANYNAEIFVHSANPVGRKNIEAAIAAINHYKRLSNC